MPAESINWIDTTGIASLSNEKPTPATRFGNWTPDVNPVGHSATRLGSGRSDFFEFRSDDLVSFEIAAIPGTEANLRLWKRLKRHLISGGLVTLTSTRPLANDFAGYCLAENGTPAIDFSDRQMNEYTITLPLKGLTEDEIAEAGDFYPSLLPNLLLWWIGDTLNGLVEDAGLIPLIPDVSGQDNDGVQATGGRMPTFREALVNGHSVMEFGGEDFLLSPGINTPTDGSSLFVVMKCTGAFVSHGAFAGFGVGGTATTGHDEKSILEQTSGEIDWYANHAGSVVTLAATGVTDWNIVTLQFETTSSCVPAINGAAGTPFDPPSGLDAVTPLTIFAGASNGSGIYYGANCQIAEIIYYGDLLSEANRERVETYLATRYGITLA